MKTTHVAGPGNTRGGRPPAGPPACGDFFMDPGLPRAALGTPRSARGDPPRPVKNPARAGFLTAFFTMKMAGDGDDLWWKCIGELAKNFGALKIMHIGLKLRSL